MGHGHNKLQTLLGAASDSSGTSPSIFIGDCRLLSISVVTSQASTSAFTVSMSNDAGFNAAITAWSIVTILTGQGIYTLDPGARWIRVERPNYMMTSPTSMSTVNLNRYYE